MGDKLRIRGHGLDAGLRGDLRLTTPANGRLAVDGSLRTVDGTYQAYGQKLTIDRGILTFTGPVENPRLDIEATRPDVDVRVGVLVTGTAQVPRIRLFSDPEMSDLDKLSWLVVGRASEGVGGADTALLQRAALGLLSGEGPGTTDRLTQAIGLDSISVRQGEGETKETIVSVGKQISKRWYVGYERGLNATTGSWQLIYRIAQRLSIRAQAGGDNAIDLNWSLRWR
jgi:translocation and assembly module TamB